MQSLDWENPYGEEAEESKPAIWYSGRPVPPANLGKIRDRQNALLPQVHELRETATELVRRVERSSGGKVLAELAKRELAVQVCYRLPDYPSILQTFGPISMEDHAVVLPASSISRSSSIRPLFSEQYDTTPPAQSKAAVETPNKLGVIERIALALNPETPEKILVYPRLLRFVAHWISEIESPIFDIRYAERPREAGIQFSTTSSSKPSPKAPALN